jgi:hypothetical protein
MWMVAAAAHSQCSRLHRIIDYITSQSHSMIHRLYVITHAPYNCVRTCMGPAGLPSHALQYKPQQQQLNIQSLAYSSGIYNPLFCGES